MARSGDRVSITDVARAAGVSPTTVSHALNGVGRVDPRTRERIRSVAEELGYRPNLRAQRLRTGQARTIGLVSSMPAAVAGGPSRLGFYMELAAAAAETALNRGFALVLVPPLESGHALDTLDIDGAVVVEPERDDPVTGRLASRNLPMVTIGRQPDADLPWVDIGSSAVANLLLEHVHAQGAGRIAVILGAGQRQTYLDVGDAYERFVTERGLPSVRTSAEEAGGEQAGYDATSRLLTEHRDVEAIYATVDVFAVGAARALHDAGLRVPDDVLVVTRYDGVRAQTCDPPLTAVNLHLGAIAAQAVSRLLGPLAGQRSAEEFDTPAPTLVRRRSSVRDPSQSD